MPKFALLWFYWASNKLTSCLYHFLYVEKRNPLFVTTCTHSLNPTQRYYVKCWASSFFSLLSIPKHQRHASMQPMYNGKTSKQNKTKDLCSMLWALMKEEEYKSGKQERRKEKGTSKWGVPVLTCKLFEMGQSQTSNRRKALIFKLPPTAIWEIRNQPTNTVSY